MLTLPDFNRLRVFHHVYTRRSILAAANDLHVTRSAVSQSLKALEEELETALFTRTSKSVTPTDSAHKLNETIAPFIQSLSSTLESLQSGRMKPTGTLKLGAPLEFGSRRLIETITKFRKRYPTVNFEVNLAIPPRLLEGVCNGTLNFAFIDNGDVFLRSYPVTMKTAAQEKFVLISSAQYYRNHLGGKNLYERLLDCDYVDYVNRGPVLKMWFRHHFRKTPSDLRIALSIESVHGIANAVRNNLGLGIVPSYIVEDDIRAGALKVVETGKPGWVNKIMLAYLEGKKLSLTEKAFMDFFLAEASPPRGHN